DVFTHRITARPAGRGLARHAHGRRGAGGANRRWIPEAVLIRAARISGAADVIDGPVRRAEEADGQFAEVRPQVATVSTAPHRQVDEFAPLGTSVTEVDGHGSVVWSLVVDVRPGGRIGVAAAACHQRQVEAAGGTAGAADGDVARTVVVVGGIAGVASATSGEVARRRGRIPRATDDGGVADGARGSAGHTNRDGAAGRRSGAADGRSAAPGRGRSLGVDGEVLR